MKALTVTQPRASLIVAGHQWLVTRGAPTTHRGPIAVHASPDLGLLARMAAVAEWGIDADTRRGPDTEAHALLAPSYEALGLEVWSPDETRWAMRPALPVGAVIGTVEIIDVVPVDHLGAPPRRPGVGGRVIVDPAGVDPAGMWAWVEGPAHRDVTDQISLNSPTTRRRWAWVLTHPVRFPVPVPARGAGGATWNWDPPADQPDLPLPEEALS